MRDKADNALALVGFFGEGWIVRDTVCPEWIKIVWGFAFMQQGVVKHSVILIAALIGGAAFVAALMRESGLDARADRMKIQAGDNLAWREPGFDDTAWSGYRTWQLETGVYRGNLWLRQSVTLDEDSDQAIFVLLATGSSELYFDGELIGRNGKVGATPAEEEPGSLLFICAIPRHLREPGRHQVAIRFSSHRGVGRFYVLGGGIGSLQDVLSFTRRSVFPFMFLSVFLVIALYFFVLFALDREQPSHVVFACMCTLIALLLFAESLRALGYPYHWHGYRLRLIAGLSTLLSALVPLFFILRHGFALRWLTGIPVAMVLGAMLFHRSLDEFAFGQFLGSFLLAQTVVCVAYRSGKPDALLGIGGISQALLAIGLTGMSFMEQWLFVCFTLLIVVSLVSLGLQRRRDRLLYQETRLRSARLQIELLKKHLQPHFMLNTLTAVMEWLEREPKTGVAFIGLLADEMKTLNRMANQTLVLLEEEVTLCRQHLEILSYRTGETYSFQSDCAHWDAMIPPALILTLVENGVSYALDEGTPAFELRQSVKEERTLEIVFKVVGVDIHAGRSDDGTGGKYIKARLEESFPNRWQLDAGGQGQVWTTRILIEGGL